VPKLVDHGRRRDEVAAIAAAVLADTGIDSSTIRDVATAGGWSTTRVTHYFASKDELLAHTLEHSIAESTEAIIATCREGVDELRAIVEQLLPLDDQRRGRWRLWLAFWGRAIGSPELAEIQRSRQSQLVTMFDEALARRGEPADAEARRAESQRLIALLDGIAVQATFLPEHWPPDRQLAYFADVLGG
jgi:AcrR family transcriptional regulator